MSARKSDKPKKLLTTVNSSGYPYPGRSSSSKRDPVYDTANTVLDVVANIAEGSDILAPLKAACRTTKAILETIQGIENNQEEWTDLVRRLKEYMSALEKQIAIFESYPQEDRAVDKAFRQPLIHYVKYLEGIHDMAIELNQKRNRKLGFLKAFSKVKVDAEQIRKLNRDMEDQHSQFMEALALFTGMHVQAIKRTVNASTILQLPTITFVASSVHNTCLDGTRKDVLQMIWDWADRDSSEKPIFWLCDIAGSGKSTVAMSTVENWRRKGALGGAFFFSMSSSEASTTEKFCSTIARDLVYYIPQLAPHIAEGIKRNPSIMRSSFLEQFQTLVIDPLNLQQERVILVLDALDECRSASQRRELVQTISTAVRGSKNLKIFMTSRPDPVIQAVLGSLSIKSKLEDRLHDVSHRDNVDDIAVYIHRTLDGVLPEDKRQRLIEKANGLFIWASTACRMLTNETTLNTPENTYDQLVSLDRPGAIDEVYRLVLERIDADSRRVMCQMLAMVLVAFEPLTVDDLDDRLKLAGIQGSGKALVQNLGSVLSVDPRTNLIQFRHPTLVEYLRRCSVPTVNNRHNVFIDVANAHGQAALWCLKRLRSPTDGLKFNVCQIESSFYLNRQLPDLEARVSKFISKRLRYASSHWLFHVSETSDNWRRAFKSELLWIIQSPYVFYWMEILSFTGGVLRAIAGLQAAIGQAGFEEDIIGRIIEIRRFLIVFSVPIQDSAPHIYISALPFTPTNSILHSELAKKYKNTLTVTQGLEETYPVLPRTLQGHKGRVHAVAFSPDGSRIVSGSEDSTIRQWDAETGKPLGRPLRSHERSVNAVAFSPTGSQFVSGSSDNTIRLWDTSSGQLLGEPLQGHEASVITVAFSPDGSRIASGSDDSVIRLWDANTGHHLGDPLRGHGGSVLALAFSPDGSRIVSSSGDRTVRLWDPNIGRGLGTIFESDSAIVCAVAYSPDGSRIASGSEDSLVRLWDANSGLLLGVPFQPHFYCIYAITFSPDGSRIVTGSHDYTLGLLDANTGQLIAMLRGHEGRVVAVGYSPDGSRIISGSWDTTIRLWDADTGQPLGTLNSHQYGVAAVTFSPDGERILSGSRDKTLRLWDTATGQPLGESLQGHEDPILALAFSPDGSRIVSGSQDNTIRLWDANKGQQLGESLLGHKMPITAVAFSPDGSQIVSGSDDNTIQLWDAQVGQPLGEPLKGHEGSVLAIAFSPDGSQIISGSSDKTIRLWDALTGQPLSEPLRGHEGEVSAVGFSPDGSQIVSGSSDHTIRLWDTATGEPLGIPLRGHTSSVTAVGFSPDGSQVVSGSIDHTIRKWSAYTGQQLGQPLRGHDDAVWAVAFSPDGSLIVSGAEDGTIRLWDAKIGLWDAKIGPMLGWPLHGHTSYVCAVTFSPDSSRIASSSFDKTILLWDAETEQPLGEALRGHQSYVYSVAFSPDGLQVVSCSEDTTIRLWDAMTGRQLGRPLRGHTSSVYTVAFSPDGSQIVSGSSDRTVRLWDAKTGQSLGKPLRGHTDLILSVSFSPGNSHIVSGSCDKTIRIWDADTGWPLDAPLREHFLPINDVAFSQDGSRIVSCSDTRALILWDTMTRRRLGEELFGHHSSVHAVAFSPDSSRIVSGSSDCTIRLWDAKSGEPLGEPVRGHEDWVSSVVFSPDGSRVASGSRDTTIRLWETSDAIAYPLGKLVPGFKHCSLFQDGWVQSSGKILFWVPPENRHGLQYPHLLTIPTNSPLRATRIDFSHFRCGLSWTEVQKDV